MFLRQLFWEQYLPRHNKHRLSEIRFLLIGEKREWAIFFRLERGKKKGIGIYGIEPWRNGEYFDLDTFENYKTFPQDPEWYFSAFQKFKKRGEDLQYSASFYVPANF